MRTWTDSRCGKRIPYADKWSHCPECHQTFGNHTVADLHRVGPYDESQRCLTPDEMADHTNSKGVTSGWRLVTHDWGQAWQGPKITDDQKWWDES